MAVLATQTIVGNIGRIYELRQVGKNNTSVVDFSVAVTPRKKGDDGEWTDGETYWVTVTAWQKLADNVAASFKSGDRVFAHGRMEMKEGYEKDGEKFPPRPIMIADFAGLEVSYHPAESKRSTANKASNNNGDAVQSRPTQTAAPAAPSQDDIFNDDDFGFGGDDEDDLFN